MQILGYIIGFILILAVIFIPICLVAFWRAISSDFAVSASSWNFVLVLDLFTQKKRIPGYWNRNFGRESLKIWLVNAATGAFPDHHLLL